MLVLALMAQRATASPLAMEGPAVVERKDGLKEGSLETSTVFGLSEFRGASTVGFSVNEKEKSSSALGAWVGLSVGTGEGSKLKEKPSSVGAGSSVGAPDRPSVGARVWPSPVGPDVGVKTRMV